MFAATLVLLNLGMQTAFSIILLTPAFMGEDFESKVDGAKAWRTGVAHDSRREGKLKSKVAALLAW